MELDDRALPLTRGQLDIWLAQETGRFGTEWQVGLFVRIEGPVQRDPLEWAIRRVMREAEPVRAACFEVDGQVFQRAIDYPDVELDFYDLSGSQPSRAGSPWDSSHRSNARRCRSPARCSNLHYFGRGPMNSTCSRAGHHIVIDASGIGLVGHRIAAVYSAIVSGRSIPPAVLRLAAGLGWLRVRIRSVHRLSGRSGLLD